MPVARIHRSGKVRRRRSFKDGASIREMVMAFNPQTNDWELPTICCVNDVPVLRKDWAETRPGPDDRIVFCALPLGGGGGGSNPAQVIASLAIAVLAAYTGGAAVGLLGLVKGSAAAGLVQGLTTAAIMIGGNMLMGSLFSVSNKLGKADESTGTYSGTVANNLARLDQPEPESFGRMMIICDRATNAWPMYIGNDQYLHQVFVVGRGIYEHEKLLFGDTVIWTKENGVEPTYDIEVEFYEPGQPVTLFPNNVEVSSEVSGQQFFTPDQEEYTGWLGPFSVNPPGTVTNRIVNHVIFPAGVGRTNDKGEIRTIDIDLRFEYRRVDDYDNPLSDWAGLINPHIIMGTTTPQRISYDTPVTEGRYQIRAQREGIHQDKFLDTTLWEGMMAFLPGELSYGVSTIALRTKATNALSQASASRFGVVSTRKLPLWNRENNTWSVPVPTRSFAAAISQVGRADYGGRLSDDRIDLDSLWRIDEILAAKGWTFDGYVDSYYNVWPLVVEMCAPFGVLPRVNAGGLGFAYDQTDRPVRHIFTPENIVRGSFSITFNTFTDDTPDDVTIEYLDEEAGFQQREVSATLPDSESLKPATRGFVGVTSRAQAFFMGVRLAAANRHRRLEFKWQTEAIGRLIAVGDVVTLNHPYLATVLSGKIEGWDENRLLFDLGRTITRPDAPVWLALNGRNGRPWGPCLIEYINGSTVRLDPADYERILAQRKKEGRDDGNPFKWVSNGNNGLETIWKVEAGPDYENRVIVTSVQILDRFHCEITAVNDAPEAYGYQELEVPPWLGRENLPSGDDLTAPESINARISGTEDEPVIILSWLPTPGAASYAVEYSVDGSSWMTMAEVYINEARLAVTPGLVYVRLAARNRERQGPWASWNADTADMFLPATPIRLEEPYRSAHLVLGWDVSESALNYTVNISTASGEVVRIVQAGLSGQYAYTAAMGAADGGPWRHLRISLGTVYPQGLTMTSSLEVEDAPPGPPDNISHSATSDSITLIDANWADDDEKTGLVVVRGDSEDFDAEGALGYRRTGDLPFTWTGLEPDTVYYFRLASADAFYEVKGNLMDLNYSSVLTISTQPED